ncbi:UNVERIFIED_CONTAM: hypothetical protein FKN15_033715 [Acipenser sinensis]
MDLIRQSVQDSVGGVMMDRYLFRKCVGSNIVLLTQAFRKKFVIPDFQTFSNHINQLYDSARKQNAGKVADYIPQLAKFSPDLWGVSLCTVDGQRHSVGDTRLPFCLQSCVKPLEYAIAIHESGTERVHRYVGKEPSGLKFNKLFLNDEGANKAEKFDYVMEFLNKMAGKEYIGFSNATCHYYSLLSFNKANLNCRFQSEKETGDRNFAIGYYLKEKKCFPSGADMIAALDFYFQPAIGTTWHHDPSSLQLCHRDLMASRPIEPAALTSPLKPACHRDSMASRPIEPAALTTPLNPACHRNLLASRPIEPAALTSPLKPACHRDLMASRPIEPAALTSPLKPARLRDLMASRPIEPAALTSPLKPACRRDLMASRPIEPAALTSPLKPACRRDLMASRPIEPAALTSPLKPACRRDLMASRPIEPAALTSPLKPACRRDLMASRPIEPAAPGLVPELLHLSRLCLSNRVIDTLQNARAVSTCSQYRYKWGIFQTWCLPLRTLAYSVDRTRQNMSAMGRSPLSKQQLSKWIADTVRTAYELVNLPPPEKLTAHSRLCSIEVTCESGSVMAATLANGGICPITGERVLSAEAVGLPAKSGVSGAVLLVVPNVMGVMCWSPLVDRVGNSVRGIHFCQVGLPAKSGVSGAVLLVVPNVMGVMCWSPLVDRVGNSVRGIHFCQELVSLFNFHNYDNLHHFTKKLDPRRQPGDARNKSVVNLLFAAYSGDVSALRRWVKVKTNSQTKSKLRYG